jgi:hypothetical protein
MIGRKLKMMLRRQQERKKHKVRRNGAKWKQPAKFICHYHSCISLASFTVRHSLFYRDVTHEMEMMKMPTKVAA